MEYFIELVWSWCESISKVTGIHPIGWAAIFVFAALLFVRSFIRGVFTFTHRVVKSDASSDPIRSVVAWILLLALTFGAWYLASGFLPPCSPSR